MRRARPSGRCWWRPPSRRRTRDGGRRCRSWGRRRRCRPSRYRRRCRRRGWASARPARCWRPRSRPRPRHWRVGPRWQLPVVDHPWAPLGPDNMDAAVGIDRDRRGLALAVGIGEADRPLVERGVPAARVAIPEVDPAAILPGRGLIVVPDEVETTTIGAHGEFAGICVGRLRDGLAILGEGHLRQREAQGGGHERPGEDCPQHRAQFDHEHHSPSEYGSWGRG